ncbi:MAG: hypothetical protein AB7N76_15775 [Planctomycetota bacterium]
MLPPLARTWRAPLPLSALLSLALLSPLAAKDAPPPPPLGSAERRARFRGVAAKGDERVAQARARIAARDKEQEAQVAAEARRALAATKPLAVPGRAGQARLIAYTARGFTLELEGKPLRFRWDGAPGALALDVLERALEPDEPATLRRLLRRAILGQELARARRYFARLAELDPEGEAPDPDDFAPLLRACWVEGAKLEPRRLDLDYRFAGDGELHDWSTGDRVDATLEGRELRLTSKLETIPAMARHGALLAGDDLRLTVSAKPAEGARVLISLGVGVLALGKGGLRVDLKLEDAAQKPLDVAVALDLAQPFHVYLRERDEDDAGRLRLVQGKKTVWEGAFGSGGFPLQVSVGFSSQGGALARVRLRGKPDADWLSAARDRVPADLAQALADWDLERAPEEPELSIAHEATSAEDEVALSGVPAAARAKLSAARERIAADGIAYAKDDLEAALTLAKPRRFWAAEYLLALARMDIEQQITSRDGAKLGLDAAIAGVEDFYEALSARAEVSLQLGRVAAARKDVEAALTVRPDYAPARETLAYVLANEGRHAEALAEARLACELAGRASWQARLDTFYAICEGPSWWNDPARVEVAGFELMTDLPEGTGELAGVLRSFRELAPKVYPCLVRRGGATHTAARPAKVFVFSRSADYYRFAYLTTFDRKEDTVGLFVPSSGHLQLDAAARDATDTLRHELTHLWVHEMGLELPYWANEAVADYLGGFDAATRKSRVDPDAVEELGLHEQPPLSLESLVTQSPTEFYEGETFLKYSLAWSFVHFCMEGGFPRLKETWFAYLEQHAGAAPGVGPAPGETLARTFAATFKKLDMEAVTKAWWGHVRGMVKKVAPPEDE